MLCSLLILIAWARYKEVRGHCHIFQMRPRSRSEALQHLRDWTWVTLAWRQHVEVTVKYVLKEGYWPHYSRGNGCSKIRSWLYGVVEELSDSSWTETEAQKDETSQARVHNTGQLSYKWGWDDMWRHSLFRRTFKELPWQWVHRFCQGSEPLITYPTLEWFISQSSFVSCSLRWGMIVFVSQLLEASGSWDLLGSA